MGPTGVLSPHRDLWAARALALGAVVLSFPAAAIAVFGLGVDRQRAAAGLALSYGAGLPIAFSTSFWPLPSLRAWSRGRRIESACLLFMAFSYATHLSWELGWLLLHDTIRLSRDAAWAYPWWAYVDGGDARYADPSSTLLVMEALSVANGVVGVTGLYLWRRRSRPLGLHLCMATAVVHLYSTSLYYGSELLEGLPNVNTSSAVDTWFKFVLANAPWLVMPWLVLFWGARSLSDRAPHARRRPVFRRRDARAATTAARPRRGARAPRPAPLRG